MQFVSMNKIREDFDAAMEAMGYVRVKIMCEKWGITPENFRTQTRDDWYHEDTFIVNGVRYISKYAKSPAEVKKELRNV